MQSTDNGQKKLYDGESQEFKALAATVTIAGTALGTAAKVVSAGIEGIGNRKYYKAKDRYDNSLSAFTESRDRTKQSVLDLVKLKKQIIKKYAKKFVKAYGRIDPDSTFFLNCSGKITPIPIGDKTELIEVRNLYYAYNSFREFRLGNKAINVALLMVQDGRVENLALCMKDIIKAGKMKDSELEKICKDELKVQSISILADFGVISVKYALSGIADVFNSAKYLQQSRLAAAELNKNSEILDTQTVVFDSIDRNATDQLRVLGRCLDQISEYVPKAIAAIKSKDRFFRRSYISAEEFSDEEKGIIAATYSLFFAVCAVINSPIITAEGKAYENTNQEYSEAVDVIEGLPLLS